MSEKFPQAQPQEEHHEEMEAIERARGGYEASKIWKSLEEGSVPMLSEGISIESIIGGLEFIKENIKPELYTKEEKEAQFEKINAYIEKLRGKDIQKAA